MYMKTLKLKNYRSFDAGEVDLQRDLTVFVGENNGGKSNAIDAIRLLTVPLSGRREIYCESTDVRTQGQPDGFDLEATFTDLNVGQQGRLLSATADATISEARFGMRFNGKAGDRPRLWAGKPGNVPEPGCHDMIRHAYLPPLRDAKRALASGNPTRILALLNHFLGDESGSDLARDLARPSDHPVLSRVAHAVDKGLSALTAGVRPQTTSLSFTSNGALIDIARDLRFALADHGLQPEDLRYSGHGYANLLYMATIAAELERGRDVDLTIFLVEEPEAHLHPQLQAAVLAFLKEQATQSHAAKPHGGPAGEVQVIVASHSPNLSAWVSSKQVVVFKSVFTPPVTSENGLPLENVLPAGATSPPARLRTPAAANGAAGSTDISLADTSTTPPRPSTRCIPLAKAPLSDIERRKIDRYLDVTKAALLFGGRVLLVEGIAEALLLPVIAERCTFRGDVDRLRVFRSAVFAPIDGVDFRPYVSLLTSTVNSARIAERIVIMTDGDHDEVEEPANEESEPTAEASTGTELGVAPATTPTGSRPPTLAPGELRKLALERLAQKNGAAGAVVVIMSRHSLESELLASGNGDILRAAYLTLHPRSGKKWDAVAALSGDAQAIEVQALFKRTRKGDFAQVLASLIEAGKHAFTVPDYIEQTILEVVA